MKKVKLNEICQFLNGYAFKSKQYVDNGIRIIRIANVQKGKIIDDAPCFYPINTKNEIEKYMLFENDLLISLTGNVGRVGLLANDMLPAALNQRVSCIRILDKDVVFFKYLYYYLQQNNFERDCIKASNGVAQLNLSTKWLENYKIYLPSLHEQQRIVTKIEELFSKLDKGVEELNKIKEQLKIYRQAVLKGAFEKYANHNIRFISDVCCVRVGIVIKPAQYYTTSEKGVKAFRSLNVREFSINDNDWVYINEEGQKENERSIVKTGDVLIVRSGYPGTSCVVNEKYDGCNAIDILIAKPDKNLILPEYLCAYTNSPYGKKLVAEKKRGVAQAHLNVNGYSKLQIPVPSLEEQKKVVIEIDEKLSIIDQIEQTVNESLQKAESLRQSILKQAFEGKLV